MVSVIIDGVRDNVLVYKTTEAIQSGGVCGYHGRNLPNTVLNASATTQPKGLAEDCANNLSGNTLKHDRRRIFPGLTAVRIDIPILMDTTRITCKSRDEDDRTRDNILNI